MGEKYTISRTSLGRSACREWAERNYMQVDKAQGNDACDKTYTEFPKGYRRYT